jgi:hypothetical protein
MPKDNSKSWRKMSVVLGILLLISVVFIIHTGKSPMQPSLDEPKDLCSEIRGTPAWFDGTEIIGYGYNFPEKNAKQDFNDVVNDYLIPNEITFIYHPSCHWCKEQIKDFGDAWIDYKESGLTKDCSK